MKLSVNDYLSEYPMLLHPMIPQLNKPATWWLKIIAINNNLQSICPSPPRWRHPWTYGIKIWACRMFVWPVAQSFCITAFGWLSYTGRSPPNVPNTFTSSAYA